MERDDAELRCDDNDGLGHAILLCCEGVVRTGQRVHGDVELGQHEAEEADLAAELVKSAHEFFYLRCVYFLAVR